MAPLLTKKIIPLSKIQVSRSKLRCKNVAAKRKAMQAIRNDGQQCPLIVDPDGQLLSDTTSYLALKALDYDLVKVVTLKDPSPVVVRAVGRLLDRWEAIRREAVAFNAALASLDGILKTGTRELVLDLLPVALADTGVMSIRLLPAVASDKGGHTPLDV
jgi:hypothetical protein